MPGYAKRTRKVPRERWLTAYRLYGIRPDGKRYEVDHLISLQLGGSNDLTNLWPQANYTKPYNAHMKDALENRLHALVCRGELDLEAAQQAIATDWIKTYEKYFPKD